MRRGSVRNTRIRISWKATWLLICWVVQLAGSVGVVWRMVVVRCVGNHEAGVLILAVRLLLYIRVVGSWGIHRIPGLVRSRHWGRSLATVGSVHIRGQGVRCGIRVLPLSCRMVVDREGAPLWLIVGGALNHLVPRLLWMIIRNADRRAKIRGSDIC